VVVGGLRLTGYDLKAGKEVWRVTGLPSYPCTTPVVAGGRLIYAGWSYGGDADFKAQMPSFDDVLKEAGEQRLGYLTRAGSEKTQLKGHFDDADPNSDGKITRAEWDAEVESYTSGRNVAFALRPGAAGNVPESHLAWKVTEGLPYVPSPLVYRGLMYTVSESGRLSAHKVQTGDKVYAGKQVGLGKVYASPVAAAGHVYLCGLNQSVIVLRAGDTPEKVSSAKLDDRIIATPAVAGNTLYVRTGKSLYAFAEGK
jgi:hypothetical protein